jgi:hypothetical protein
MFASRTSDPGVFGALVVLAAALLLYIAVTTRYQLRTRNEQRPVRFEERHLVLPTPLLGLARGEVAWRVEYIPYPWRIAVDQLELEALVGDEPPAAFPAPSAASRTDFETVVVIDVRDPESHLSKVAFPVSANEGRRIARLLSRGSE